MSLILPGFAGEDSQISVVFATHAVLHMLQVLQQLRIIRTCSHASACLLQARESYMGTMSAAIPL